MPVWSAKFGVIAIVVTAVLLLASSLCVVNCLAADQVNDPPCHKHAPSKTQDCAHTALTAVEHGLLCGAILPELAAIHDSGRILRIGPGMFVPAPEISPPPPSVLRI